MYSHSDLYGAVSHPLKIARTVITGQSLSVVCRLLYLLTYFIRCSEIQPGFVQVCLCTAHCTSEGREGEREKTHERERETDRDRERERETERERDRERGRETERERERQNKKLSERGPESIQVGEKAMLLHVNVFLYRLYLKN